MNVLFYKHHFLKHFPRGWFLVVSCFRGARPRGAEHQPGEPWPVVKRGRSPRRALVAGGERRLPGSYFSPQRDPSSYRIPLRPLDSRHGLLTGHGPRRRSQRVPVPRATARPSKSPLLPRREPAAATGKGVPVLCVTGAPSKKNAGQSFSRFPFSVLLGRPVFPQPLAQTLGNHFQKSVSAYP